jgi:hypothetical protein
MVKKHLQNALNPYDIICPMFKRPLSRVNKLALLLFLLILALTLTVGAVAQPLIYQAF